jgi:hypothetical protein
VQPKYNPVHVVSRDSKSAGDHTPLDAILSISAEPVVSHSTLGKEKRERLHVPSSDLDGRGNGFHFTMLAATTTSDFSWFWARLISDLLLGNSRPCALAATQICLRK